MIGCGAFRKGGQAGRHRAYQFVHFASTVGVSASSAGIRNFPSKGVRGKHSTHPPRLVA